MIFRLYKIYSTGKTLYKRVLKPVYEELRKDAYALDEQEQQEQNVKKKTKYTRKKRTKDAVDKKPGRSNKRTSNT